MKNICTICMRENSKGVRGKNYKILNGKPLMAYTIEAAIESRIFDKIVVSTDSKKIANIAAQHGLETWFLRPKNLAKDSSPKIPVIRHALMMAEEKFNCIYDNVFDY